jgi:hypothetical protein
MRLADQTEMLHRLAKADLITPILFPRRCFYLVLRRLILIYGVLFGASIPMSDNNPPPVPRLLADGPNHWRQRAEEMRALADTVRRSCSGSPTTTTDSLIEPKCELAKKRARNKTDRRKR